MPVTARTMIRLGLSLPLALVLPGCIVASIVDTAADIAVGTVKVGAAVVEGTVVVAAAGVSAVAGGDDDKQPSASAGQQQENRPAAPADTDRAPDQRQEQP